MMNNQPRQLPEPSLPRLLHAPAPSDLLLPGEGAPRPGRWGCDQFKNALLTAEKIIPEAELLAIVRAAFPERTVSSWQDFLNAIGCAVNIPSRSCFQVLFELVNRGLDLSEAVRNTIGNPLWPFFQKCQLTVASMFATQPLGWSPVDLVSCAFLAHPTFECYIANGLLIDASLERVQGNRRLARVIYLHLDPEGINWLAFSYYHHVLRLLPLAIKEPPAEVTPMPRSEAEWQDRYFPGKPLGLGVRPSLKKIAARHGLELTEKDGMLNLAGKPIATPDQSPERMYPDGFFRARADVKLQGGRPVINFEGFPPAPFEDFILRRGHRYHRDRDLLFFDFQVNYTIGRLRHFLIFLSAKFTKALWPRVAGHVDKDFWTDLRDFIDASLAGNRPPPLPAAESSAAPRPLDPEELHRRLADFSEKYGLSRREAEILERTIEGKSNREIADECSIAEPTVKTHIGRILQKTGFKSRSSLIASFLS